MKREIMPGFIGKPLLVFFLMLGVGCSNAEIQLQGNYYGTGTVMAYDLDENCEPVPPGGESSGNVEVKALQIDDVVLGTAVMEFWWGDPEYPIVGTNDNGHVTFAFGLDLGSSRYECSFHILGIENNGDKIADVLQMDPDEESSCTSYYNGNCMYIAILTRGEMTRQE